MSGTALSKIVAESVVFPITERANARTVNLVEFVSGASLELTCWDMHNVLTLRALSAFVQVLFKLPSQKKPLYCARVWIIAKVLLNKNCVLYNVSN